MKGLGFKACKIAQVQLPLFRRKRTDFVSGTRVRCSGAVGAGASAGGSRGWPNVCFQRRPWPSGGALADRRGYALAVADHRLCCGILRTGRLAQGGDAEFGSRAALIEAAQRRKRSAILLPVFSRGTESVNPAGSHGLGGWV